LKNTIYTIPINNNNKGKDVVVFFKFSFDLCLGPYGIFYLRKTKPDTIQNRYFYFYAVEEEETDEKI